MQNDVYFKIGPQNSLPILAKKGVYVSFPWIWEDGDYFDPREYS